MSSPLDLALAHLAHAADQMTLDMSSSSTADLFALACGQRRALDLCSQLITAGADAGAAPGVPFQDSWPTLLAAAAEAVELVPREQRTASLASIRLGIHELIASLDTGERESDAR